MISMKKSWAKFLAMAVVFTMIFQTLGLKGNSIAYADGVTNENPPVSAYSITFNGKATNVAGIAGKSVENRNDIGLVENDKHFVYLYDINDTTPITGNDILVKLHAEGTDLRTLEGYEKAKAEAGQDGYSHDNGTPPYQYYFNSNLIQVMDLVDPSTLYGGSTVEFKSGAVGDSDTITINAINGGSPLTVNAPGTNKAIKLASATVPGGIPYYQQLYIKKSSVLLEESLKNNTTYENVKNIYFVGYKVNPAPTVESNAEAITVLPNAEQDLYPVFFVMGKATTGKSPDNSQNSDSLKTLLKISGKDDGTIDIFKNLDGNNNENANVGSSGLMTEQQDNNLIIKGNYNHEPGGLYTRHVEYQDNNGASTAYFYRIIGYTDELIGEGTITKFTTESVTTDEVLAMLNLSIKSTQFNNIRDEFQEYFRKEFTQKYGQRTIVGYKKSSDADFNTSSDLSGITDKSSDYDIKVKTTNPWGQEVYNIVKVKFVNIQPPNPKVKVVNTEKLTEADKKEVIEEIKKANTNLPADVKITVEDNGKVTVEKADGTPLGEVSADKVVEKGFDVPKDKVKVVDPDKLTDDEKKLLEDKIKEINKDKLPEGATVTVDEKGNVTIADKDGKVLDKIAGEDLVEKGINLPVDKVMVSDPAKLTEADKKDVIEEIKKANLGLTDEDKITVADDGSVTVTDKNGVNIGDVAGKDVVTQGFKAPNPKVKVADPTSLTRGEIENIENAFIKANPDFDESKYIINVDNTSGTITVFDKKANKNIDKIAGEDIIEKGINPPTEKVKVLDPAHLTDSEKEEVIEAIKKANPGLPADAKITVADDGKVTVTDKDDVSIGETAGSDVVEKGFETPNPKVKVVDPDKLTDGEKKLLEDKIKEANKDALPEGATVTVDEKGNVTIADKDGKVLDKIAGEDIIEKGINPPTEKVKVLDPAHLTDSEKEEVIEAIKKANPGLPADAKITVTDDGTVTVTDKNGNAIGEVQGREVVAQGLNIPNNKVPVGDTNKLTDQEKELVKKAIIDANPTVAIDSAQLVIEDDGTVKYVEKDFTDIIHGADLVVRRYSPVVVTPPVVNEPSEDLVVDNPAALTEEEKEKLKKEIEAANPHLSPDTKIEVADDGTVTVKSPYGGVTVVKGTNLIKKNEVKEPENTDPKDKMPKINKPVKVLVKDSDKLTKTEKEKVKVAIKKANPKLPKGTTISVSKNGNVTITYPNGKIVFISGKDVVKEKKQNNAGIKINDGKKEDGRKDIPRTGDEFPYTDYILAMALSVLGIYVQLKKKKVNI